jgi:hypothetical protein
VHSKYEFTYIAQNERIEANKNMTTPKNTINSGMIVNPYLTSIPEIT